MQRPATRGSFMTQLYSSFSRSYVDTTERTSRPYSQISMRDAMK